MSKLFGLARGIQNKDKISSDQKEIFREVGIKPGDYSVMDSKGRAFQKGGNNQPT